MRDCSMTGYSGDEQQKRTKHYCFFSPSLLPVYTTEKMLFSNEIELRPLLHTGKLGSASCSGGGASDSSDESDDPWGKLGRLLTSDFTADFRGVSLYPLIK